MTTEDKDEKPQDDVQEAVDQMEDQIDAIADGPDLFDVRMGDEADSEDDTEEGEDLPGDLTDDPGDSDEPGDEPPKEPEAPETPEESEETPDSDPETPDDEDIPDIPEGETPKGEQFRNVRNIAKQFKKQRNDAREKATALEQRVADLEQRIVTNPATPPAPASDSATSDPSQPAPLSAGQVFDILVKAKSGDFDERSLAAGQTNASIAMEARQALSNFGPKQILEVLDAAGKGMFGVYNDDVIEEAQRFLPVASARAQISGDSASSASDTPAGTTTGLELSADVKAKRDQSTQRVYEKYPDLSKQDSELTKRFHAKLLEFQKEKFGTPTEPGPEYWRIASDPNLPEWQAEQVMSMLDSEKPSVDVDAVVAENKALKKKVARSRQPVNTTGSSSSSTSSHSGDETVEDLEKQIDALADG